MVIIIVHTSKDCYQNEIGICMQISGPEPDTNRYLIEEGGRSGIVVVVEITVTGIWRIMNKCK